MGMTIRTNTGGNTSCRNLKKTSKKGDSNLQKLSSGYQINKSADDASGLGITEKMRAQINALETISPGCQDGINLLNTADGYLDEVQNMLVRMTELSEKSANGILEDDTDREALQKEMNQLGAEIDRIADTANFNGNKLFVPKVVTVYDKVMVDDPKSVDYSQYFSSPAPNYMELNPSLVTAAKDDEQRMRGDTLTRLADKVKEYMTDNGIAEPNMVKGKMYYNKDGEVRFITSPGTFDDLSDADKAALGDPCYSVDTFPSTETKYYPAPKAATPEQLELIGYNPKTMAIGGNSLNAQIGTYKYLVGLADGYVENNGADGIEDKIIYYRKDKYEAEIVDDNDENKNSHPSSDWYAVKFKYTPAQPADPNRTIPYKEYHIRQSYIAGEKEENIPREVEMPITLQIGETSQRADKLNINLYDLHTDKLFKETREIVGYEQVLINVPAKEPSIIFEPIEGDSNGMSGHYRYDPGHPAYSYVGNGDPIEEVRNATRDNTDTSAYENAKTLDISNQEYAISNVTHAREVTDKISLIRASYGAMSNRLEKTISNHENTIENMSSAKSRIKDTDMAKEMMSYTQNNVLQQAAQSMLSQANTQPQNVLQLLQ